MTSSEATTIHTAFRTMTDGYWVSSANIADETGISVAKCAAWLTAGIKSGLIRTNRSRGTRWCKPVITASTNDILGK